MSEILLPRVLFPTMWMSLNRVSASGTVSSVTNRMELLPHVFQDGFTLDKLGLERNSGTTTGKGVVVIYSSDPTTLAPSTLLRYIKVDIPANNGLYTVDITPLEVTRGQQLWIGTIFSAVLSMAACAVSGHVNIGQVNPSFLSLAATKFSRVFSEFSADPVAWVPPATITTNFSTDFSVSGNTPNVMFRAVTINPSAGGEDVDITPIMDKLADLELQITSVGTDVTSTGQTVGAKVDLVGSKVDAAKVASDDQFSGVHTHVTSLQTNMTSHFDSVNDQFNNVHQVVQDQATSIRDNDNSQFSAVQSSIEGVHGHMSDDQNELKTILAGIGGIPQNVIDMIMDIHAEAMGSWSWDKRAGTLTMFDTHGLEVAVFTITDTPDVSSRERRTDLESS